MHISDWSSNVCSSDLTLYPAELRGHLADYFRTNRRPAGNAASGDPRAPARPTCGRCQRRWRRSYSAWGSSTNTGFASGRSQPYSRAIVASAIAVQPAVGAPGAFHRWAKMQLPAPLRSEEHTSELQSLMRISYAVFGLKK